MGNVLAAVMAGASWALGHPEKVTDFGFRGIHTMTEVAKATIKPPPTTGRGCSRKR